MTICSDIWGRRIKRPSRIQDGLMPSRSHPGFGRGPWSSSSSTYQAKPANGLGVDGRERKSKDLEWHVSESAQFCIIQCKIHWPRLDVPYQYIWAVSCATCLQHGSNFSRDVLVQCTFCQYRRFVTPGRKKSDRHCFEGRHLSLYLHVVCGE